MSCPDSTSCELDSCRRTTKCIQHVNDLGAVAWISTNPVGDRSVTLNSAVAAEWKRSRILETVSLAPLELTKDCFFPGVETAVETIQTAIQEAQKQAADMKTTRSDKILADYRIALLKEMIKKIKQDVVRRRRSCPDA